MQFSEKTERLIQRFQGAKQELKRLCREGKASGAATATELAEYNGAANWFDFTRKAAVEAIICEVAPAINE